MVFLIIRIGILMKFLYILHRWSGEMFPSWLALFMPTLPLGSSTALRPCTSLAARTERRSSSQRTALSSSWKMEWRAILTTPWCWWGCRSWRTGWSCCSYSGGYCTIMWMQLLQLEISWCCCRTNEQLLVAPGLVCFPLPIMEHTENLTIRDKKGLYHGIMHNL